MNSYPLHAQLSFVGNPNDLSQFFLKERAAGLLNKAVVPYQEPSTTALEKSLFCINLNHSSVDRLCRPSDSHSLSHVEPLMVKKVNVRAQKNWEKAFSLVRQLVKGVFQDCLVIKEYYYPEALDPRHEYAGVQNEYFAAWKELDATGDHSISNYFQLLELYRRPIFSSDISSDGKKLIVQDPHRYASDRENNIIDRALVDESWVFTGNANESQLAVGVYQFSQKESRENFGIFLLPRKVMFAPNHYDKDDVARSSSPVELIFVSDQDQFIYAGFKVRGVVHHSSFLSGKPVAMAGTLTVCPFGRLLHLSNASGHYQPGAAHCIKFLRQLECKGIDLSELKFDFWNKNMELAFEGRALDWLQQYQHSNE